MTDAPQLTSPQIDIDYPCIHCGYNLRGLCPGALCPECGHTIQVVDEGELLRFADPKWIEKLRFGTALKLWAIVMGIVIGVGVAIIIATVKVPMIIFSLIGPSAAGLALWGTWCITAQEPRQSLKEKGVTLRGTVRTLATLGFIGSVTSHATRSVVLGAGLTVVATATGTILSFGSMVAAFGELFYYRRFARRIPDQPLTRSTTRLIWASGIVGCLWVVAVIGMAIFARITIATGTIPPTTPAAIAPVTENGGTPATPTSAVPNATASATVTTTATVTTPTGTTALAPGPFSGLAFLIPMCLVSIAGIVLFFWYVRLLTKYRSEFQKALGQSQAHQSA